MLIEAKPQRSQKNYDKDYKNHLSTPRAKDNSESSETSSLQEFECDFCNPMMHKHRILSESSSLCDRIKYTFSCPPHGKIGQVITWLVALPVIWGVLIAITGEEALPGGNLFSLACLLLLAQVGGYLVSFVRLPPLLGMLLVGIALRSLAPLEIIGTNIDQKGSATLRKTALVIILNRAGLGLDPKALREMSLMVLRLGALPNLVEMSVVAVISHFLLAFPWLWSVMLGFIIVGVSPSVVVPCMLSLSDSGFGLDKGVPTLVIAGLSVDNVISISGFGVLLGITFSSGSLVWQTLKGPIKVLAGLGFALVMGSLLWYFPNRQDKGASKFRFFLLLCAGLLAIFGSMKVGFGGAGPIGCLGTAFVAGIGWRKQGCMGDKSSIKKNFSFLWQFFLPLLFGLIGTEIKDQGNTVEFGVLTLLISVTFRIITSYFCVMGGNLNLKERIFVALAWIIDRNAAVGSTALDMARAINQTPDIETPEEALGKQVLTIAVLVILIAAPIGAVAIMLSAPKLLNRKVYKEVASSDPEKGTELQDI